MKAILNKKKIIKGTNIKVPLTCGSSNNYLQGKFVDGEFHLLKSNGTFSEISMIPIEGKIYEDVTTGKLYKWNGSEYEETNSAGIDESNMTEVKYSELVELRNSSKLVPGKFYRITDYENNSLVNFDGLTKKKFDIILLALTENKLAEEGWAAIHENDVYDVTFADNITKKCYVYILNTYDDHGYTMGNANIVDPETLLGVNAEIIVDTNDPAIPSQLDEENKTLSFLDTSVQSTSLVTENLKYNDFQNSDLSNWKLWYCLDNDKFNLSETSTDKGIIYRIEDSTGKICKLKWRELKTLRDSAALVAGAKYRIIDYVTTTVQENTRSAGHQFDIVLLALSEDKLAEEGWAMMNESNVYDVTFNDGVTKKCWIYETDINNFNIVNCDNLLGQSVEIYDGDWTIDEEHKTIVITESSGVYSSDNMEEGLPYNYFSNSNLSAWKVWYCLDNDSDRFAWASDIEQIIDLDSYFSHGAPLKRCPSYDGAHSGDYHDPSYYYAWGTDADLEDDDAINFIYSKNEHISPNEMVWNGAVQDIQITKLGSIAPTGVIYRLIDEFNNDIKYDFKNIQFTRPLTDGEYDEDEGVDTWCYTLNVWYEDSCQDASIVGNTIQNDEGYVTGVYYNVFGCTTAYDIYIEGVYNFAFALGDNVVLSIGEDGNYYGIYSNTIGNSSYNNTIGDAFCNNIIGGSFISNKIGSDFTYNVIGVGFSNNTIGTYFGYNTIGISFGSNTIGDDFANNTIGNRFSNNTIGNSFGRNTIGNDFYYNTTAFDFGSTTIGEGVNNITIEKSHVHYNRIEDGVRFVNITTSATTSYDNYLQNIIIGKGIKGTQFSRKTITHTTVGDTFQTTYLPTGSSTVNV